ncbi:ABC transporter permease [Corynebacterium meridianum]|uniref:ABC transporter permease n=1 Tax=Corynebacterium meridianum TaxID=2765363 RepID=UPI003D091EBF
MTRNRRRTSQQGRHRPESVEADHFLTTLVPVAGRPPLIKYIGQLWQRRFFIQAGARAKAFAGSRNLILGNLWLILSPLFDLLMYGLLFGVILKTSRGIDHFILFLIIGIIMFRILSKDLAEGVGMIRSKKHLIKAFPFPRAALVISNSLRTSYDSIPPLLVLFVVIMFYPGGPAPTWKWTLFPLLFILVKTFSTGLTFIAAWSTHLVPDLSRLIQLFSRFWFYGSGVFFSIDRFVEHPFLLQGMQANPAYQILTAARGILIYDSVPPPHIWVYLSAWASATLILGFVLFWSAEANYAKY